MKDSEAHFFFFIWLLALPINKRWNQILDITGHETTQTHNHSWNAGSQTEKQNYRIMVTKKGGTVSLPREKFPALWDAYLKAS